MATGGYNMKWGKGYLGGGRNEPDQTAAPEGETHEPGANVDEQIHGHLTEMHAATGHGHSHVQHHQDGSHTSHHIGHDGKISGPHHHGSTEEMADHMRSMGGEGENADEGEDEQEAQ